MQEWWSLQTERCLLHMWLFGSLVRSLLWHPRSVLWSCSQTERYIKLHTTLFYKYSLNMTFYLTTLHSLTQDSKQMSFATMVDTVSILATRTTANVPQITQAVTVSPSLTTVRTNLASMVPPVGATWEDSPVMWVILPLLQIVYIIIHIIIKPNYL